MISCFRTSKTCVQVLMPSVTHGVLSDRTYAFKFESSLATPIFFVIFCGTIILEETQLAYVLHEKSVSYLLDRTTNCEWWKWFSKWSYLIQTKVYRSSYRLTDQEFINLNGIDYLEIHKICLKSLPLIYHKFHQYFNVCVWELWMWQGGNLSNPELAKELISGQLILNLNWPCVTREHVNHPTEI